MRECIYTLGIFIFYLARGGFMGGYFYYSAYKLWVDHVDALNPPLHDQKFWQCVGLAMTGMFLMLLGKVIGSQMRKSNENQICEEHAISSNFTFWGHIKALLPYVVPYAAAQIKILFS